MMILTALAVALAVQLPSIVPQPMIVSLEGCYTHDFLEGLSGEEASHVIGLESCCWTEYIPFMRILEVDHLPRLGALSENAWGYSRKTSFDEFVKKVNAGLVPIYKARGYEYTTYGLD